MRPARVPSPGPSPAPPPEADALDDPSDPKLAALRVQLGPHAWAFRVERARARAAIATAVSEALRAGRSLEDAVADAAADVAPQTVARWIARYEAEGLEALVDRQGLLAQDTSWQPPTPPRPRRNNAQGRQAISFLKWVGSKREALPHILAWLPPSFDRYYEPMVGSGVLFFSLAPRTAVLTDVNAELINCYQVLRDQPEALIAALSAHVNSYPHFIEVRAQDPGALDEVARAARTIYLNKTCFNGLYRVNRDGHFNVPYGRNPKANFCDEQTLRRASGALQGVELRTGDFEQGVEGAAAGDIVYFDPPYYTIGAARHRAHRYQPEAFDEQEHARLAALFRALDARGCHVYASNANLEPVRALYAGFHIETLRVRRSVSAKVGSRDGDWSEVLISNRPPPGSAHPARQQSIPPFLKLEADARARTVADLIWGYGPLPRADAAALAGRELVQAGLAPSDASLGASVAAALDRALVLGALDSPAPGQVRAIRPDPETYAPRDWTLVADVIRESLEPAERGDPAALLEACLGWARANLGLDDADPARRATAVEALTGALAVE